MTFSPYPSLVIDDIPQQSRVGSVAVSFRAIEVARTVTDPLPAGEDTIAKGKALFEEKAFCTV